MSKRHTLIIYIMLIIFIFNKQIQYRNYTIFHRINKEEKLFFIKGLVKKSKIIKKLK